LVDSPAIFVAGLSGSADRDDDEWTIRVNVDLERTDRGQTNRFTITYTVNGEVRSTNSSRISVRLDESVGAATVVIIDVDRNGLLYAPELNAVSSIAFERPEDN